ncbi:MAG: type II toxin-antitoxin system PemK/MazF family toxin [Chloroflexi bacterium HGW-Chloroflexi-1]|nr:MAG: type II toxin-antitoxin system PemK/MazF family toxin [Chloroflexi bacterium HGW-Chloroflexi-1]
MINQGDLFRIDLDEPTGSEPGYLHPYVVIQNNVFNHSRINTVVVCGVTSNLTRATSPANVLLESGEGHLPQRSVVNVTQIYTVTKADLGEKIGALSPRRMRQILDGIKLVLEPREAAPESATLSRLHEAQEPYA